MNTRLASKRWHRYCKSQLKFANGSGPKWYFKNSWDYDLWMRVPYKLQKKWLAKGNKYHNKWLLRRKVR